jgi:hypothetical protein
MAADIRMERVRTVADIRTETVESSLEQCQKNGNCPALH